MRGIRGASRWRRSLTIPCCLPFVRKAAATSARVSGADIDAFAIGYLVGLAACGDTRLRITPKQHARDWSVPLLLWVLLVAPPSSMKSEVIKAARALAASLDMQERERYRRDVADGEFGATLGLVTATMTRAEAKRAREEASQKVAPPRHRSGNRSTARRRAWPGRARATEPDGVMVVPRPRAAVRLHQARGGFGPVPARPAERRRLAMTGEKQIVYDNTPDMKIKLQDGREVLLGELEPMVRVAGKLFAYAPWSTSKNPRSTRILASHIG